MEILSPAGSKESVKAAIYGGADAIYMGYGDFNARRNAKNFTLEEFSECVNLCNVHNVKVLVTMNIILNDRELVDAVEFIKFLGGINISAVIVQDLAVAELIKNIVPDLPLHASTQLTVHNLAGANKAFELGFTRVVLSRELSYENIAYICKHSKAEIEVFAHGALCMSYSGQCYFSSMIGSRSGNRGLCAQPCRLPYSYDDNKKKSELLSLKDLSLVDHIHKLKDCGVACIKIEGRMKRPEYTALVTQIYSSVLRENRMPTQAETDTLKQIFSRNGFTDGYFERDNFSDMFGMKDDTHGSSLSTLFDNIADEYNNFEKKFLIDMEFFARCDKNLYLKITERSTNTVVDVVGDVPSSAISKASDLEQVSKNLCKTGGTIFTVNTCTGFVDDGLFISASSINQLRRDALSQLEKLIITDKNYEIRDYTFNKQTKNVKKQLKFSVEVNKISQITRNMQNCEIIYVPIIEISQNVKKIQELLNLGFNICAKLPRIVTDDQFGEIISMLDNAKNIGISSILISNICFTGLDFITYGDFSLNIYNSLSLEAMKNLGLARQTISFELKTQQIRDILKSMPTEILGYGYLPLMIFENCLIKANADKGNCENGYTYLSDRKNQHFVLLPEFGGRNTLINSKPLYILDKINDFNSIGIDVIRLLFTTETADECDKIYSAHINFDTQALDLDYTRGLYYRGTL